MDMRNAEGYVDLTAGIALANVTREQRAKSYRPLVYIASPFVGDNEKNIERACGYCRFAVRKGFIPLAPHLLFSQFMRDDDEADQELAGFMGIVLLTKCAELWVFGDVVTKDMSAEIARAIHRGQPVRHFTDDCEEVPQ